MSKIRQLRTADHIKVILSELILREVRDPRLQYLTITEVRIDRELQFADIYVSALGDDSREDSVMDALNGASSYFRSELAPRLNLRTVPQLHFHWDLTLANAERVSQLLDNLDIPDETELDAEE